MHPRMALLAALLCFAAPVSAQDTGDGFVALRDGEEVQLRADRAYILYRVRFTSGAAEFPPALLRIPTEDELEPYFSAREAAYQEDLPELTRSYERQALRYERGNSQFEPVPPTLENYSFEWDESTNLQAVPLAREYEQTEAERVYLIEATPGDYVVYGLARSNGGQLLVCFCLGTVGATAQAGEITDFGTVIGDWAKEQSVHPELAEESGFGPSSDVGYFALIAGTIRPVEENTTLPSSIDPATVVPASYRAIGRYFNPNTAGINRLVPVPGVLDYDRERVIDVQSGEIVPDNL